MFSRVPSWFHGGLTLTLGAILSAGVVPFIFISLAFAPFASDIPLLQVALWLSILGFSGILVIFVTVFIFPKTIPVTSESEMALPSVIKNLPEDVQERILKENTTNLLPSTITYSAGLSLRGLNILAGAYAATLAYASFNVAGLVGATIVSGIIAARHHLEIQTIPEKKSPLKNGRIPTLVEQVSDDLNIETPDVYRTTGRGIGAVDRENEESYLLVDPSQFDEYSDEELRALLAHEVAHIDQSFGSTTPVRLRPVPFVVSLVISVLFTPSTVIVGVLLGTLTLLTHFYIVSRRRQLEFEADKVAANYAGAIPTAVVLVRESTMAPLTSAHTPLLQVAELLSTHPRTVERLERIFDTTTFSSSKSLLPYDDGPFDSQDWTWPEDWE